MAVFFVYYKRLHLVFGLRKTGPAIIIVHISVA